MGPTRHRGKASTLRRIALVVWTSVLCFKSAQALADEDFLAFKDPPERQMRLAAPMSLTRGLTDLKKLIEQPVLWQTRQSRVSGFDAPSGPVASGLFTPRHTGRQIALYGEGADATVKTGGFGLSLVSKPLTISGMAPIALDTSDVRGDQGYNLGLNMGIARFQLGAAVSRVAGDNYNFDATGLDVDVRYLGDSWQTNLALSGVMTSDDNPAGLGRNVGFIHDQSFAVEWGASYLLTPSLSLGGSLRFSGFKNANTLGLGDVSTTDSAVFLGTNLEF